MQQECVIKGICLESRYPRYTCSSDFTFPLAVGAYGSLQLLIQPWICAPGTHYGWVDQGSVEYEVCPTLLHMASTSNRTPDLLILSPTPYPLGHVLTWPRVIIIKKLHEIPYHTVNTWNEVVNLFLPCYFVRFYKIMFSVQVFCVLFQPMTNTS